MDNKTHWQALYKAKALESVSWYSPHLLESLAIIQRLAPTSWCIIDVGAGGSTLIDDLLERGYSDLTAIDLSAAALAAVEQRLGPARAARVSFLAADICTVPLPADHFDIWHDRATFHFLTSPGQRSAYVAQAARSLKPKGYIILGTFGPDGPTRCSGLDVQHYDARNLAAEFSPHFELRDCNLSIHRTPGGITQQFLNCVFQKL